MPLEIGTVLESRYRIDGLLGAGGMGAVYRAWDLRLDQYVALKENAMAALASARQFEREAKMMARLRHSNLPRVMDHFVAPDGAQYLIMDYVEGEDLGHMINRVGPLDEARALAWIEQVCDALTYLHGQQPPIIHRDIKPSNIKITPEGRVFLVDFGIAKVGDAREKTSTGALGVTPGFSPPEQYGTGGTDVRSDVYALGATLYALLTGQHPPDSVQRAIQVAVLTPPQELCPDLSPTVASVLERALKPSPTDRPQTVVEFRTLLRGDLGAGPKPAPSPPAALIEEPVTEGELDALYQEAQAKIRRGAWVEARDLCRRIETIQPGYRDVRALLEQVAAGQLQEQVQRDVAARLAGEPAQQDRPRRKPVPSWIWIAGGVAAVVVVSVVVLLIGLGGWAAGWWGSAGPTEVPAEAAIRSATEPPTNGSTRTSVPPLTEKPGEFRSADPSILVDLIEGDPDTLDPAWSYEVVGNSIIMNVYEPLITVDGPDATSFVPALATDWEISADGLTYVFTIRQGVTFHDGADLTPEDVAYSFRRGLLQGVSWSPQWLYTEAFFGTGISDVTELVDPEGTLDNDPEALQAADAGLLMDACQQVVDAIEVVDDDSIAFYLEQPWEPLMATLAHSWGSIIDKDWAIQQGAWDGDCATWQYYYGIDSETSPLRDVMNGTGPYVLDYWTSGEEIVLVANPVYWRSGPVFDGGLTGPTVERVVIMIVDDWDTRFEMLQEGDADFAHEYEDDRERLDPLVGELCEYQLESATFDCGPTENPDAPLRLFEGQPDTRRFDAFFVFDINVEEDNPYVGSGRLDGDGIPQDFFSDAHIRRAFNYCFDWDAYITGAFGGEGVQNVGPLIPGMLGYDPDGPHYTFDLDTCAEELQQAWDGEVWENGFRLQIPYNTGNVTRQTVAKVLQSNFADLAPRFRIEIVELAWPEYFPGYRDGLFPIYVGGWAEDIHDPHNWAVPFLVGTYASRQNMPGSMREEFQDLVDRGVAATDWEERAAIYEEATYADYYHAPAIRLAVATGRHYEQRWVRGWYYNPSHRTGARYYAFSKE
jgi:peptide/nickel transport system substrate-binding protein